MVLTLAVADPVLTLSWITIDYTSHIEQRSRTAPASRSPLITFNSQPSTVNSQPSTVNRQPSTVNRQPSTVNRQPSTVNRQQSTVNPFKPSTSQLGT
jgi:hypothetical protein